MSTKGELRNIVKEAVTKVLSGNRLNEMDYGYDDDEDPYMNDLEKEFPFLKDEPEMGGRAPAHVQRSMDDEMPVVGDDDEMEGTVTEASDDETFDMVDMVVDALGHEKALEAVVQAMSRDEAQANLKYIIQQYDLGRYDADLEEKTTDKHDDNPALKGGQDSLPDELQKAIIGEEDEEKLSPLQKDLRRRQAMKSAYDEKMQKEYPGLNDYERSVAQSKSFKEAVEDDITSSEDRYGDMKHVIPGVRFTGDIERDVKTMEENEELGDWLYGELESGDVITDSEGRVEYTGADVQDYLNTDDVVLPDIAETQEDFYSQMRTDARTISEDWNKSARNKRSALLNERLMKAWNFKK